VSGGIEVPDARPLARTGAARAADACGPDELTWLLALPAASLLLAAILLLGPPLGRLLEPSAVPAFVPALRSIVRPEPTEHARYLLALAAPVVLAAAVVALVRRGGGPRHGRAARTAAQASQLLLAAFLVAAVVGQHAVHYRYEAREPGFQHAYFTWPTLAFAALAAGLALALLRRDALVDRVARALRDTRRRTLAARTLAIAFTLVWLLCAINSDSSASGVNPGVAINLRYWIDESYAVLNGRAPLVTFHSQYAQLLPYAAAAWMRLVGASVTTYSAFMVAGALGAVLCVYAVLARIARSALAGLTLYVPFAATSFFTESGPPGNRYGPVDAFSMFPIRYGGPYLLAWLTARSIDGARPRQRVWLFAAAGLVAIDNLEFGLPALGATCAALLAAGELRHGSARRRLGEAALGIGIAIAAVLLLTLAVAGSLPRFSLLLEFPRVFGVYGFGMLPMPAFGLHLAVYVTFAAAIAVATARALRFERDRLLTAMLAWAGVFGLGAGAYFAGRSHPQVLVDLFSAWALALTLLVVVAVRALRRPGNRPTAAHVAVLAGLGLAIASIAQIPAPWSQIARLGRTGSSLDFPKPAAERLVRQVAARGERVVIWVPLGPRVAYDLGLVDVSPYASGGSAPLVRQLTDTLAVLRASGGHRVFLLDDDAFAERKRILQDAGFRLVRLDGSSATAEFSDER
jgi:hypothetical protein